MESWAVFALSAVWIGVAVVLLLPAWTDYRRGTRGRVEERET